MQVVINLSKVLHFSREDPKGSFHTQTRTLKKNPETKEGLEICNTEFEPESKCKKKCSQQIEKQVRVNTLYKLNSSFAATT